MFTPLHLTIRPCHEADLSDREWFGRFTQFARPSPMPSQRVCLHTVGIVPPSITYSVPKVEYRLTEWGQALCPALDALLQWAEQREQFSVVQCVYLLVNFLPACTCSSIVSNPRGVYGTA